MEIIIIILFVIGLVFLIKETGQEIKKGKGKEEFAWNGISFSNNFSFIYGLILLILLLFLFLI